MPRTQLMRSAMLAAIAFVAACSHTDPAIQAAVDARLAGDPATTALGVDIAVTRGTVRLEGEVESQQQRQHALDVTRSVPGVKAVIDAMHLSDAAVMAAVTQALASDSLVGKIPIVVNARQGRVQLLSDQTGPDDRSRAVEVVSKVPGVTHVEDLMR